MICSSHSELSDYVLLLFKDFFLGQERGCDFDFTISEYRSFWELKSLDKGILSLRVLISRTKRGLSFVDEFIHSNRF